MFYISNVSLQVMVLKQMFTIASANSYGENEKWYKNRKQKKVGKKSFQNKWDKFPLLLTPKCFEVLQRIIYK